MTGATMRHFLDCEFNGFGGDLISMALVSDDDRELYLATECRKPIAWVKENVIPIIGCKDANPSYIEPSAFGRVVAAFLSTDPFPCIVADWPDDIKYFCQSLITGPGEMVSIKRLSFQLDRIDAYPTELPGAVQHNALWDARALRYAFQ
jgi:hypothetical protein